MQELTDLVICYRLSAGKAGIETDIVVRSAQHYVRQYKLKEDSGWLPGMKRSHLGGNNPKLNEDHTKFSMIFLIALPQVRRIQWEGGY